MDDLVAFNDDVEMGNHTISNLENQILNYLSWSNNYLMYLLKVKMTKLLNNNETVENQNKLGLTSTRVALKSVNRKKTFCLEKEAAHLQRFVFEIENG